jgi:hypothetical protein
MYVGENYEFPGFGATMPHFSSELIPTQVFGLAGEGLVIKGNYGKLIEALIGSAASLLVVPAVGPKPATSRAMDAVTGLVLAGATYLNWSALAESDAPISVKIATGGMGAITALTAFAMLALAISSNARRSNFQRQMLPPAAIVKSVTKALPA